MRLFLLSTFLYCSPALISAQTVTSYGQILTIDDQTLDDVLVSYPSNNSFNQTHNSCALTYTYPFPTNPNSELDTFRLFKNDRTTTGLTGKDLLLLRNYILGNPNAESDIGLYGDFSQDGGVSTLDLLFLGRVILREEINSLDNPWDFYIPSNTFPAMYEILNTNQFVVKGDLLNEEGEIDDDLQVRAFKVGDVDGSYWSDNVMEVNDICTPSSIPVYPSVLADLDSVFIEEGQLVSIPIKLNENLDFYGMHFSFQSDKVETVGIKSDIFDLERGVNYNFVDSSFVMFHVPSPNIEPIDYVKGQVLFTLTLRANEDFFLYDLFEKKAEFPREVYVDSNFQTLEITFEDLDLTNVIEISDISFEVFPNPFNDQLFMQCGHEDLKNVTLSLVDLQGRLLSHNTYPEIISKQKVAITIPDSLSDNIYFLRITSEGKSTTKKVISID